MTGRVGHQVISVFVAITILSNFSDCGYCPASAPTVSVVSKCPNTKTEWEEAASRKKCTYMSAKCGDKTPVYHCLLNQWRNETVEVCASTWYISGFCAVYNIDEMKIIDDFQTDCTKFTEDKCPTRYISSEAYLYQKCYEKRDLEVTLTDKTHQEINDNTSYIAAMVVVILLAIFMGIFLLLTCLGKIPIIVDGQRMQCCKKNTDEETTLTERATLIDPTGNVQSDAQITLAEEHGIISGAVDTHNSTNVPYSGLLQNGGHTSSSSNADSDEEPKNNEQNKENAQSNSILPKRNLPQSQNTTSKGIITGAVNTHNSTNVAYSGLLKNGERTSSSSNTDSDKETESNEQSEEEAKQDELDVSQQDGVDVSQQVGVDVSKQVGVDVSQQDGVDVSQQDGVDLSQQDGVDGDVSKQDGDDVSQQNGVNVSKLCQKFEVNNRSFP